MLAAGLPRVCCWLIDGRARACVCVCVCARPQLSPSKDSRFPPFNLHTTTELGVRPNPERLACADILADRPDTHRSRHTASDGNGTENEEDAIVTKVRT